MLANAVMGDNGEGFVQTTLKLSLKTNVSMGLCTNEDKT